jgi:hypothetical protein
LPCLRLGKQVLRLGTLVEKRQLGIGDPKSQEGDQNSNNSDANFHPVGFVDLIPGACDELPHPGAFDVLPHYLPHFDYDGCGEPYHCDEKAPCLFIGFWFHFFLRQ